jgi:hypothetical protein
MNSSSQAIETYAYIEAVLSTYTDMPETPMKAAASDRKTARELLERAVPLPTVQTALVLGSVRRLGRPPEYPRLQPVRSLAYFLPVIEELLESPIPDDYGLYLRAKLKQLERGKLKRPQPPTGDRPETYVSS